MLQVGLFDGHKSMQLPSASAQHFMFMCVLYLLSEERKVQMLLYSYFRNAYSPYTVYSIITVFDSTPPGSHNLAGIPGLDISQSRIPGLRKRVRDWIGIPKYAKAVVSRYLLVKL